MNITYRIPKKEEAEAVCREISQKSQEEVKAIEERAVSSCDLQRRKALLTAKQEIIAEVLAHAYQVLIDADDWHYIYSYELEDHYIAEWKRINNE